VRDTGEASTLDEMSSRDRWVVHNAIKDVSGVRSESVGDGRLKRVKILPD
jgi:predicted RNA-binding protein Jag